MGARVDLWGVPSLLELGSLIIMAIQVMVMRADWSALARAIFLLKTLIMRKVFLGTQAVALSALQRENWKSLIHLRQVKFLGRSLLLAHMTKMKPSLKTVFIFMSMVRKLRLGLLLKNRI